DYDEEDDKRRRPRRFSRLQFKFDSEGWTGDRRRHLFTVAADGSAPATQLTHGDFEDRYPTWSPDGNKLAFISSRQKDWDIDLVSHVYVVDPDGGEPGQLTEGEASFTAEVEPVGAERFTATSSDGSEVDAWVMRPQGFEEGRRYPVLLNIHGGPFAQYGNRFFDEFQVYTAAGYVVLFANPRGSSGYS